MILTGGRYSPFSFWEQMLRCAKFPDRRHYGNFLVAAVRPAKRRSKVEPAALLTLLFWRVGA
jgi:hypothetical protein